MRRIANTKCGTAKGSRAPGSTLALSFSLLLGAFGCAPPEAPAKPVWDVDVYPLLRGSCLHCHGENAVTTAPLAPATATTPATGWRFDICDPTVFKDFLKDNGLPEGLAGGGAIAAAPLSVLRIEPLGSEPRAKMPPPPAATLSDYEIGVLKNWAKVADCRKRLPNHEPRARLISSRTGGSDLWVTIEVTDADSDQALGKVSADTGGAWATIPGLGRRELKLEGASSANKITVILSDGYSKWGPVDFDL